MQTSFIALPVTVSVRLRELPFVQAFSFHSAYFVFPLPVGRTSFEVLFALLSEKCTRIGGPLLPAQLFQLPLSVYNSDSAEKKNRFSISSRIRISQSDSKRLDRAVDRATLVKLPRKEWEVPTNTNGRAEMPKNAQSAKKKSPFTKNRNCSALPTMPSHQEMTASELDYALATEDGNDVPQQSLSDRRDASFSPVFESAYFFTISTESDSREANENRIETITAVSDDDSNEKSATRAASSSNTSIVKKRSASFLIKPRVISSCSGKKRFKDAYANRIGRPLPVPPRLPRVNAGVVVGLKVSREMNSDPVLVR